MKLGQSGGGKASYELGHMRESIGRCFSGTAVGVLRLHVGCTIIRDDRRTTNTEPKMMMTMIREPNLKNDNIQNSTRPWTFAILS